MHILKEREKGYEMTYNTRECEVSNLLGLCMGRQISMRLEIAWEFVWVLKPMPSPGHFLLGERHDQSVLAWVFAGNTENVQMGICMYIAVMQQSVNATRRPSKV